MNSKEVRNNPNGSIVKDFYVKFDEVKRYSRRAVLAAVGVIDIGAASTDGWDVPTQVVSCVSGRNARPGSSSNGNARACRTHRTVIAGSIVGFVSDVLQICV